MTESWRPVVGWEDLFEVSDHGRVRALPRTIVHRRKDGKDQVVKRGYLIHRGRLNTGGRRQVTLQRNGESRKALQVHRLVLEAFVGPCPPGMECCHNDGDPTNNVVTNLRWDTPSANARDRVRHGRHEQAEKTACINDHPFDALNTIYTKTQRVCRQCNRQKLARYRDRKRQQRSNTA